MTDFNVVKGKGSDFTVVTPSKLRDADKIHHHPQSGKKISGQLLIHKDEIKIGDMYDHPNGEWVQVPDGFAGSAVLKDSEKMFVRPATGDFATGVEHIINVLASTRESDSHST